MSHHNNPKRRSSQPKLDEFPDEFDDTFFHNELVDSNRKIPLLRNIVYRKLKDAILEKVTSYDDNPPLSDKFDVDFPTDGFSDFEWAVVREEIMSQGIDVTSEFKDDKLVVIHVHIERNISLTTSMSELNKDSDDEDTDGDED